MPKTIKDIIEEVVIEINSEDVPETEKEVIAAIESEVREFKGEGVSCMSFEQYTANELSKIACRLAILKVTLGDIISKANKNLGISENVLKLKKANLQQPIYDELKKSKDKPTVGDVIAQLDRHIFKDRLRRTFKEEHLLRLQNLWWSIKSILDVISQRITILQGERSESKWLDETIVPSAPLETLVIKGKDEIE